MPYDSIGVDWTAGKAAAVCSNGGDHMTVKDMIQIGRLSSLELIAGRGGLGNEVKKIGILDYEFTPKGMEGYRDASWLPGEFILTSFLYLENDAKRVADAIRRLINKRCPGIAIRNVFHLPITAETINLANKNNFPIFIIRDPELYFENIIIEVEFFKRHLEDNYHGDKILAEIMCSHYSAENIKEKVLEMNYRMDNSYTVYCILPKNPENAGQIEQAKRRLISKGEMNAGDAIAAFHEGIYYIHSISQYRSSQALPENFLYQTLEIEPASCHVGIGTHCLLLGEFKKIVLQSYYAALYAKIYGAAGAKFSEIGIYQTIFPSYGTKWMEEYCLAIREKIDKYDKNTNGELWNTLLVYEKSNGNIKEVARIFGTHENTIRNRLRKLSELFGKCSCDEDFKMELLLCVKWYKIREAAPGGLYGS